MKPLSLSDVRKITGGKVFTVEQAAQYVSRNQPRQITRNQALALSLHTWHNTETDWLRLESCLVLLRQRARGKGTAAALAVAAVVALAAVQPSTAYARGYHSGGFHHSSSSHSHSHSHRW
jgi:hypothetical protein